VKLGDHLHLLKVILCADLLPSVAIPVAFRDCFLLDKVDKMPDALQVVMEEQ